MKIAQMVLVGKINQELVGLIGKLGGKAVGLNGVDGGMIKAKKLYLHKEGEDVDLGYVGEVEKVQTDLIDQAIAQGYIPSLPRSAVTKTARCIILTRIMPRAASLLVSARISCLC